MPDATLAEPRIPAHLREPPWAQRMHGDGLGSRLRDRSLEGLHELVSSLATSRKPALLELESPERAAGRSLGGASLADLLAPRSTRPDRGVLEPVGGATSGEHTNASPAALRVMNC